MKVCFNCGVEKVIDDFYKHPAMSDGHLNKCKECCKVQAKKRQEVLSKNHEWVERERKRGREKYHRLQYKESHKPTPEAKKKTQLKYLEKYPEKYRAKSMMGRKVRATVIGNQLHHWSYNIKNILDVIELSAKHHQKAHRFIVYDQERMMYRRCDNNELLDTKEKHIAYINMCIETKED